jgi:hypothetical protein
VAQRKVDEPIHILNIGIRYDRLEDDDCYARTFEDFCAEQVMLVRLALQLIRKSVFTNFSAKIYVYIIPSQSRLSFIFVSEMCFG